MKHLLISLTLFVSLTCCQKQKTPEQLFEERASGVVVILNEYYFEMKLPNGNKWFFTGFDEDGDLENFTPDENEIKKNREIMTGTGFFVDSKGTIMTNRHVAEPKMDFSKAKNAYMKIVNAVTALLEYGKSQMQEEYAELENEKENCSYFDLNTNSYYYDNERIDEISAKQQELEENYNEVSESINDLRSIEASTLKIITKFKIGIG